MRGRLALMCSLAALVPAGVNAAVPASSGTLSILICTGDGAVRHMAIPAEPQGPTPAGDTPCCAKGCQTGSSRKRGSCC